ncbi:thiamine/thiamine pyrophosphate ABC transporter permease ThiP [Sulfitobacter mediterraneus]|uniref:Thiamine transport system permease protein n=1 Tax=Sulfitobacter mediterraneus TaxID=83219 RepID=A0A2T6CJR1_9RHOB|nr:thiamine/thiamine pyrophosphate ABC transporter permease ThiP [Sulfitobacter mediterraneus]KIN78704.1 Thiamin ABC transporter membrane component [Sulfitobacter mediterraneus KCTC 32188]PTX75726.1 thiamine transport system permease protein [Sulfitobacter mediterraneus]
MARRVVAVKNGAGIGAAILVAVLVLAALLAVMSRAETGAGLLRSDWAAVRFTVWQAVLSSVISTLLAIPVARALARRRFAGRALLVTLLGAPFILPVIVAVLGLLTVFGRSGWLNQLLGLAGVPEVSIYGLHGVVLAHVFFNLPLATRLILQGWQSIPAERFRLAAQLRLGPRGIFLTLEWPLLRQVVPGVAALIFVICLTSFAVALTLGGGPKATTLELAIYQAFLFDFDLSRAALLSLVQLVLAGGAALAALWIIPAISLGGGQDRTLQRWDARGGLQRAGDGAVITLAALFLLLPLAAVLLRGVAGLPQVPAAVWQAAGLSVFVAVISVLTLCLLALPMAGWIATRQRGGVEAIGLLGLSASPLMIGTGWFILINPVMNPSDLALPVTALVNAMMALPFALRILVPRLRDTLADFGRLSVSLGLQGWPLWRWVILPRLRGQLGFAAGLTGALSVGDLGVIALFADQDRTTLPLQMYRLMGAYRMEAAAGAALILLALALGIFWICDRGGRWHAES